MAHIGSAQRFERCRPLAEVLGGWLLGLVAILTLARQHRTGGPARYAGWFADHQIQGVLAVAASLCALMFAVAVRRACCPAGRPPGCVRT